MLNFGGVSISPIWNNKARLRKKKREEEQAKAAKALLFAVFFGIILLMAEVLHYLIGVYPIIYRVLYIPGGAGFLPSTVLPSFLWDSDYVIYDKPF